MIRILGRSRAAIACAFIGSILLSSQATAQDTPDKAAIEQIVRDYILANPEIVTEALQEIERRAEAEERALQAEAVVQYKDALIASPRDIVLGNPDGAVTLVEFFDYNCSFCRRAMNDVMDLIDTVPELRVVIKEYPVLGPESGEAARVSAAVGRIAPQQWEAFRDGLLGSRERADEARALAVADGLGVDMDALQIAMQEPETVRGIIEASQLGRSLGINGTPSYVIGNQIVIGAQGYDALREVVDAELEAAANG